MNRRGKRVTLGVMVVGLAVVLVLAIAYRKPILEHIEAWHFQLTTETVAIEPDLSERGRPVDMQTEALGAIGQSAEGWGPVYRTFAFLNSVANYSGYPVFFASEDRIALDTPITLANRYKDVVTADIARALLQANGWRVLAQRFPRRAYVVIRSSPSQPPPEVSWPQADMSASMKEQLERAINEAAKSEALQRAQREP